MTKICKRCEIEKSIEDFPLKGAQCKRCRADYAKAYCRKRELEEPGYLRRKYDAQRDIKYNLAPGGFQDLLERQGGCCAVCGIDDPMGHGTWHVDHDHTCCPGEGSCGVCVRGILCSNCNTALGLLGDDVDRLISAATYLMQHVNVLSI